MLEKMKSLKDKLREQGLQERKEESEQGKSQRKKRVTEGRKIKKLITKKHG